MGVILLGKGKQLERPVQSVCPLEIQNDRTKTTKAGKTAKTTKMAKTSEMKQDPKKQGKPLLLSRPNRKQVNLGVFQINLSNIHAKRSAI